MASEAGSEAADTEDVAVRLVVRGVSSEARSSPFNDDFFFTVLQMAVVS